MKKIKKCLTTFIMGILMLLTTATSVYANEVKKEEVLQPGWIKINEYHYENPTTGEYFKRRYNLMSASSDSVSFDFSIRYSFDCPTKFKPSSSSATVSADAHVEDESGTYYGNKVYGYRVTVGSKKVNFKTGTSGDKKVTGLRVGSTNTITVSTTDSVTPYYVVGSITIE